MNYNSLIFAWPQLHPSNCNLVVWSTNKARPLSPRRAAEGSQQTGEHGQRLPREKRLPVQVLLSWIKRHFNTVATCGVAQTDLQREAAHDSTLVITRSPCQLLSEKSSNSYQNNCMMPPHHLYSHRGLAASVGLTCFDTRILCLWGFRLLITVKAGEEIALHVIPRVWAKTHSPQHLAEALVGEGRPQSPRQHAALPGQDFTISKVISHCRFLHQLTLAKSVRSPRPLSRELRWGPLLRLSKVTFSFRRAQSSALRFEEPKS